MGGRGWHPVLPMVSRDPPRAAHRANPPESRSGLALRAAPRSPAQRRDAGRSRHTAAASPGSCARRRSPRHCRCRG
eukprot:15133592-Alexandrium_andersonii.AAC.1